MIVVLAWLIALAFVAFPGSPATNASRTTENSASQRARVAVEPSLITQEQVEGWLKFWQQRLGLVEWTIDAKIVRVWELPAGAVANIHWSLPKRKATIKVLHSADSNLRQDAISRDTELSVVHELVHLSMAKLPLDPNHTELEEEAVKKLSAALLALYYSEPAHTEVAAAAVNSR
ncbi:MAG: hypothetical protein HYZ57_17465 [Acidobacteria bacterium]|nr:hypothetical protein [Acidobacteriota bacterium]